MRCLTPRDLDRRAGRPSPWVVEAFCCTRGRAHHAPRATLRVARWSSLLVRGVLDARRGRDTRIQQRAIPLAGGGRIIDHGPALLGRTAFTTRRTGCSRRSSSSSVGFQKQVNLLDNRRTQPVQYRAPSDIRGRFPGWHYFPAERLGAALLTPAGIGAARQVRRRAYLFAPSSHASPRTGLAPAHTASVSGNAQNPRLEAVEGEQAANPAPTANKRSCSGRLQ